MSRLKRDGMTLRATGQIGLLGVGRRDDDSKVYTLFHISPCRCDSALDDRAGPPKALRQCKVGLDPIYPQHLEI